jgi:hypothetical protein
MIGKCIQCQKVDRIYAKELCMICYRKNEKKRKRYKSCFKIMFNKRGE